MVAYPDRAPTEQILVRVSPETYSGLQLAQVFQDRRSMQDLVGGLLVDFVANLRVNDPGFEKALIGLRESRAQRDGQLAKRRTGRRTAASE